MPKEEPAAPDVSALLQMEALDESDDDDVVPGKKALLYPELHWGLPPSMSTPTQGRKFLQWWEGLMSLACLWVGVVVPYTLGFAKVYIKGGEQCLFLYSADDEISAFFLYSRYVDVVVDVMFLMDMGITFVTARWELRNDPMPHWVLIDDLNDLRNAYLKRTFFLDFVAWLPVQYLDCASFLNASFLRGMSMLRLIKLLRLKRLGDVIANLQERYPKSVYFFASIQLFLYFFLGAHWTACSFFAIGYGLADPQGDEYARYLYEQGWVYKTGVLDENGLTVEFVDPWVAAMYWAVTTMSTIGYGDIFPVTAPERILGMMLMVMGCAFFAWITGKITHLMTERSPSEKRFVSTMEEVETFMKVRMMPTSLQDRIQDYYKVKYPNKSIFDEQELIENIDSPLLKRAIVNHLFKDVVRSVPLFKMCSDAVKVDLCFRLKSIYRMKDRQITLAGDEPEAMYSIRFGSVVAETLLGTRVKFAQGELFGEMAMLGLTHDGKRCRSVKALSVCELCELSRHDFLDLLKTHSEFLRSFVSSSGEDVEGGEHNLCTSMRALLPNGLIRQSMKIHLTGMRESLSMCVGSMSSHFQAHLERIDWQGIADEIRSNLRSEIIRYESSKFGAERISSVQAKSGKKVLYTNFYFQISNISGDLSFAAEKHEKCVITMAQDGFRDSRSNMVPGSGTHNDSEVFGWIPSETAGSSGRDGKVDIFKQLHLPVLHPHKTLLNDLPPIRVAVMMLASNPLSDAIVGKTTAEVVPTLKTNGKGKLTSKTFPAAHATWFGQLSLSQAVELRKGISSKGIMIELTHTKDPSKRAVLECSVRVNRKPLLSVWGRVINRVVANGSSAFFESRIQRMLDNVSEETELFQSAIRDKRVSMFRNFSTPRGNDVSLKPSPDLTREEALEQEIDVIFQKHGHSDEMSVVRSMQTALEVINTRIKDQGSHLRGQASRIKSLRSSIAEVHLAMASQLESFSNNAGSEIKRTYTRPGQGAVQEVFLPDPLTLMPSPHQPMATQVSNALDMRASSQGSSVLDMRALASLQRESGR